MEIRLAAIWPTMQADGPRIKDVAKISGPSLEGSALFLTSVATSTFKWRSGKDAKDA